MDRLKVVVFCGAGASVGAGLPVMASFAEYLRRNRKLSAADLADFDQLQAHCGDIAAYLGTSSRNVEQMASLLDILALCKPTHEFAGCTHHKTPEDARRLINRALFEVYSPPKVEPLGTAWRLLELTRENDLTVVTTNYDLNVEITAAQVGAWPTPTATVLQHLASASVPIEPANSSLYRTKLVRDNAFTETRFNLIKLHGSVNWFRRENGEFIADDRIVGMRYAPDQKSFRAFEFAWGADDAAWRVPEQALLVAPTVLKSSLFPVVREQWEAASAAICTADVLLFVGYSFPESDTFMKYFFAAALHRNVRLKLLAVIDPEANAVCARAGALLAHPEHSAVLKPIPLKWEPIDLSQLVKGEWKLGPDQIRQIKQEIEVRQLLSGQLPIMPNPDIVYAGGRSGR